MNRRDDIIKEFRGQFLQMQFIAVLELYGFIAHLGGGEVRVGAAGLAVIVEWFSG